MKEKDILIVIEELGKLISDYKKELKFKDYQIKNLKLEIEKIEGKETQ